MSVLPKRIIPTDCPGCGCIVLSDEFYCSECAAERASEQELDAENTLERDQRIDALTATLRQREADVNEAATIIESLLSGFRDKCPLCGDGIVSSGHYSDCTVLDAQDWIRARKESEKTK